MRFITVTDYSLDLIGGAQRAMLNQASALVAAGHEVLLVAPRPRSAATPSHVRPHWIDGPRIPGLDFTVIVDDAALRERLGRLMRGADAVLLHSEFGLASAALGAARRCGVSVVHTVHTVYWPAVPPPLAAVVRAGLSRVGGPVPFRLPNVLLERTVAVAAAADAVVSPSGHQADDLSALGVPNTVVLPNCAADERASAGPLPTGPLHVAWIGRLVPEKRILPFLAAVRSAVRQLPPGALRVSVAGSGPLLLPARLLATGVPGLRLLGRLDAAGVRALLADAHLSALTSDGFDNQPMTVTESIRAGRGVVFVDPRLHEGLDEAGLLARTPDAAGIADLLVDVATDRSRAECAAAGAHRAAALFSPARHVAGLLRAAGFTDQEFLADAPSARLNQRRAAQNLLIDDTFPDP